MIEYFEELSDSRQQWKIKYRLAEVVVMAIIAVTAGAEHWSEISMYCQSKERLLKDKFKLKPENGIPTEDTFQRIFAIIKPKEFERCFMKWIKSVIRISEGEIVSVGGKTLKRGSRDEDFKAIHMVSAWANQTQVVLGQIKVDEKSNEIPAVPELLDMIEVEGCVITSDAMSCQKETVKKIIEKKCEYVICLKGNQGRLHDDVKLYFETAQGDRKNYPLKEGKTKGKDHGRIERREYFLTTDIEWIENREEWANLNAIGMVRSRRIVNGIESSDDRYFISSTRDIDTFSKAVRQHWGIENSLHWCLDLDFNEDRCRMRKDNSAENFAIIRI